MFSIVTVSHGHDVDCVVLFESLVKYIPSNEFEIIVVDNLNNSKQLENSLKEIQQKIPSFSYQLIKNSSPKSFSFNNNLGVSRAKYEKIVLLNPDIVVQNSELADFMISDSLDDGAFYFPKLLNSDGTVQVHKKAWPNFLFQCLIVLLSRFNFKLNTKPGEDWAFAAAVCFKRATFERIGGFDTGFGLYCEDVEIAHRLKRMGGRLIFLDDVALIHGLGGEAKNKYMKKAILSNVYLRYAYVRNSFLKRAW